MAISLSTITSGVRLKAPKIVVYGVGGIGKTTFAACAPDPIFMFTEEGQGALDVARFEPRQNDPVLRSWEEIMECIAALYNEKHDYKTVVLDSIDLAEPMLWKYTSARNNMRDIEAFGFGKGYVYAADEGQVLLNAFDTLRNDRGMAIVIVAHHEIKRFESPDTESYDRFKLRLHDRFAARVHDWADAVLFANYESTVVKDKEDFNKERKRAVGMGARVLYTQERPAFWAKNRYSLPFKIPLDWNTFQSSIVVPNQPAIPVQLPSQEQKEIAAKA